MNNNHKKLRWLAAIGLFLLLSFNRASAQLIYQPYSYQFDQKLNSAVYSPRNAAHTAIKPYYLSDTSFARPLFDSLTLANYNNKGQSWIRRVIFNQHLVEVKHPDYTFYLDFLPDLDVGREFHDKRTTYLNTRGFQAMLTVSDNFFIYSSGYENQGKFPNYETNYIHTLGIVPSQGVNNAYLNLASEDWSYVTALIGYKPTKGITLSLGQDKTFIGDGYRSMLLSDFSLPSPLLRLNFNLGPHVQYMAEWAYLEDQKAPQFASFFNNRRKWAAFHFIDWNITNRASLGFFNAVITAEANGQGQGHGFDINYVNPIFFSSGLQPSGTITDHTLFGFNGKYKVLNKTTVYGQVLVDQTPSSATNRNRTAWQVGLRGADLFGVPHLNYLAEHNSATPYTYANQNTIVNYAQYNAPLANPLGANFNEWLGLLNYSIKRWDFQGELLYSKNGQNIGTMNYGSDLTLPDNVNVIGGNSTIGQGLATSLKYAEGTVAFVLNPKNNLRIELSGLLREQKNSVADTKTVWINLGLRSSFRNLYHDF